MLNQLSILLTHPLHHTKNKFLLASGKLHEIATDKFHDAFKLLNDCISTLQKFECGMGIMPSFPLIQADEAKAARTKLNKTSKRPAVANTSGAGSITPDSKHQRVGKTNDGHPNLHERGYDALHQ